MRAMDGRQAVGNVETLRSDQPLLLALRQIRVRWKKSKAEDADDMLPRLERTFFSKLQHGRDTYVRV